MQSSSSSWWSLIRRRSCGYFHCRRRIAHTNYVMCSRIYIFYVYLLSLTHTHRQRQQQQQRFIAKYTTISATTAKSVQSSLKRGQKRNTELSISSNVVDGQRRTKSLQEKHGKTVDDRNFVCVCIYYAFLWRGRQAEESSLLLRMLLNII